MDPYLTEWGGTALNDSGSFTVRLLASGSQEMLSSPVMRPRPGRYPAVDGAEAGARTLDCAITQRGTAYSQIDFLKLVRQTFNPDDQPHAVKLSYDGTDLLNTARLVSVVPDGSMKVFAARMLLPDPVWRTLVTTTDSSSPLTTNGNARALPLVTVTPTGAITAKRARVSITDVSGRGLWDYPVMATFNSTGVSATTSSKFIGFHNKKAISHYVNTPDNASTKFWARVNVQPLATSILDIYFGSSVDGSITADTLEFGGLELTAAAMSNTNWLWNDWRNSLFPGQTGTWKPVRTKGAGAFSDVSCGITAEGPSSSKFGVFNTITLSIVANRSLGDGPNALELTVGSAAGATNALANLFRVFTPTAGTVRFFVEYRVAGSSVWQPVTSVTTFVSSSAAIDVDDAVQIRVGFEPLTAASAATLEIGITGGVSPSLTVVPPTVSVAALVNARVLTGALTVPHSDSKGDDVVAVAGIHMDDEPLLIDALTHNVSTAGGVRYGEPRFSNAADWVRLTPGSNTWTSAPNSTTAFAYEDGYIF